VVTKGKTKNSKQGCGFTLKERKKNAQIRDTLTLEPGSLLN